MNQNKHDASKLAATLAPLEEQNPRAAGLYPAREKRTNNPNEAIVVDSRSVKLADNLLTDKKFNPLRPPPLVLAIVGCCVVFILFVAWQISKMPPK